VNAVFANKIADCPRRAGAHVENLREEYRQDIDLRKLAANLHVDAVVDPAELRGELVLRLSRARRREPWPAKRRQVTPV